MKVRRWMAGTVIAVVGAVCVAPATAFASGGHESGSKTCSSTKALGAQAAGNGTLTARAGTTVKSNWFYFEDTLRAYGTVRSGHWSAEADMNFNADESYGFCTPPV